MQTAGLETNLQAGCLLCSAYGIRTRVLALTGLGGTAAAFALNGFTFFIGAVLLFPLLRRENIEVQQVPSPSSQSLASDFKEGIGTVFGLPWLWISIAVFALCNVTLTGPYTIALPFLVADQLNAGVQALGLLYALFAVGYVLGGVWLGRKVRIRRRGGLIYGGLILAGMMLLAMGLPIGLPAIAMAALLNGAAMEVSGLAWTNALQAFIPQKKLGRVASVDTIGSLSLIPIGYGLTGLATELWGASFVFALGGTLTALSAFAALYHPAIRGLD